MISNAIANVFEHLIQLDVMGLHCNPYFEQFLAHVPDFHPHLSLLLGYLLNSFSGFWVQRDLRTLCLLPWYRVRVSTSGRLAVCVEQVVVYSTLPQEYSTLTFRGEVVAVGGKVEERSIA